MLTGKLDGHEQRDRPGGGADKAARARRRAGDPRGRGHRDAADGRAVRCRADDRRSVGASSRKWEARGFRYSYDMLGEAAADRRGCARAISPPMRRRSTPSARRRAARGFTKGPGISIKLSALHPRYARAQRDRVMARTAAAPCRRWRSWRGSNGIGLNIDAEEADRLDLSLDLLEALCLDAGIGGLERHRLRRAGLSETRALRAGFSHRPGAAHRSPADGPAGEGRLLG